MWTCSQNRPNYDINEVLQCLCNKFKYKPTVKEETEESDETTKALQGWFRSVKTSGRPPETTRVAINTVLTCCYYFLLIM